MNTTITRREVWKATCNLCSWVSDHNASPGAADTKALEHEDDHTLWRLQGKKISKTDVLDTEHPAIVYFGNGNAAAQQAKENGQKYLVWNGAVYHRDNISYDSLVCYPRDIEGLLEKRKSHV